MAESLYFYKLISPYSEDHTKNCKLTVSEIDSNFLTLKDYDIKEVSVSPEGILTLTRNNGETLSVDLSEILDKDVHFDVSYNPLEGWIRIEHGDKVETIQGVMFEDNFENLKAVITDGSINGNGTNGNPLSINPMEKTGTFKPVLFGLDLVSGEDQLPTDAATGDRYVTHEKANTLGYLYDYPSVQAINERLAELGNGWRVPTKKDWDNMLNAIEPCKKNHEAGVESNNLGKYAGKLLKSKSSEIYDGQEIHIWDDCNETIEVDSQIGSYLSGCDCSTDEDGDTIKTKKISPSGVDRYGFRVLPTGSYGCNDIVDCGSKAALWTSTEYEYNDGVFVKGFSANRANVSQIAVDKSEMHGLRLVKDYNGSNQSEYEYILGNVYKTVLMPSDNTPNGFSVWTAVNVDIDFEGLNKLDISDGCLADLNDAQKDGYYLNEWNGCYWEKRKMNEGESVVVKIAYSDGEGNDYITNETGEYCPVYDVEFRLINGKLVSVNSQVYKQIMDNISPILSGYGENIDSINEELGYIKDEIISLHETDQILSGAIDNIYDTIDEKVGQAVESAFTEAIDVIEQEIVEIKDDLLKEGEYTLKADEPMYLESESNPQYIKIEFDGNFGEIPEE